jgi:LysR family transcriptional regulator for bpeEF and oprC
MDRLDVMRLFIRVVESGSFSKAARAANIAQPTVSKHIAALEERLGAQLLRRTPRGLGLTGEGQDYYESAVRLLKDIDTAEARIGKRQIAPSGTIRVALSAGFGRMFVVPRLPEFFAAYPDVTLDLDITERHVNLIEDGIDVAIRIGNLSDSTLVARRIGSTAFATAATPSYLEKHGEPKTPDDLEKHACVIFLFHGAARPWHFHTPSGPVSFEPKGPIRSNDGEHLRAAVLAGLGIGHNASWLYADDIESSTLVHILRDFAPATLPINAVHPAGRRPTGKVKVFTDFLTDIFAENPHLRVR